MLKVGKKHTGLYKISGILNNFVHTLIRLKLAELPTMVSYFNKTILVKYRDGKDEWKRMAKAASSEKSK